MKNMNGHRTDGQTDTGDHKDATIPRYSMGILSFTLCQADVATKQTIYHLTLSNHVNKLENYLHC